MVMISVFHHKATAAEAAGLHTAMRLFVSSDGRLLRDRVDHGSEGVRGVHDAQAHGIVASLHQYET